MERNLLCAVRPRRKAVERCIFKLKPIHIVKSEQVVHALRGVCDSSAGLDDVKAEHLKWPHLPHLVTLFNLVVWAFGDLPS